MAMEVRVKRNKVKIPSPEDHSVRVGWFGDTRYSKGVSVASVARILEFGSPWPFMRPTTHQKQGEWRVLLKKMCKDAMEKGTPIDIVLKQFGEIVKGDIQSTIISTVAPSNAPATIKKKGFDKPLVDTGMMLASVQSRVDNE